MSPVIIALQTKAAAQNKSAAQWLWAQAALIDVSNAKMTMPEMLVFIDERLEARANDIESAMRKATHPFLWPFSDESAATLYPDESSATRIEIRAAQMQSAANALRSFVIGDILALAGDDRAARYLGDPKVSGSKGEGRLLLESAADYAKLALSNVGQSTGQESGGGGGGGGGNMTLTTHYTNPVYPNGFPQ